jgi:hypothetical protein
MLVGFLLKLAFGGYHTHWLFNILVLITLPITIPFIALPIDIIIGIIRFIIGIIMFIFSIIWYFLRWIYYFIRLII